MKQLIILAFFVVSAVVVGTSCNSCAPTEPLVPDTTKLLSAPSNLSLTRADSSQSSSLGLNCGCPFGPADTIATSNPLTIAGPLTITGVGDTSIIHFTFHERLDTSITVHTINATIDPTALKSAGSSSSWIAFYYLHDGTIPLYDTLFVTATY